MPLTFSAFSHWRVGFGAIRGQELFCIRCFVFGDLDQDATGGHGITIEAQGREFMRDNRMKLGRLEARPRKMRIGGVERCQDGDEFHTLGCHRLLVIGKYNNAGARL